MDFPAWKSLYDELIHQNQDLTDIQKFSYLRAYLSGAAANVVESVTFSAANYPIAYQSLVERYQRKRVLANAFLSKILNFQPLSTDNVKQLHNFLDTFDVAVNSLKGLQIPDLGEFFLLQLGLNVLDPVTQCAFETENISENFPTFDNLIKFVKHKCSILELTKGYDKPASPFTKKGASQQKSLVMQSTSYTGHTTPNVKKSFQCSVCHQGEHRIASCPKFLRMDSKKRFHEVRELKLCFACLSSTHSRSECRSAYKCKECGSDSHHSLLHFPTNVSNPPQTTLSSMKHFSSKSGGSHGESLPNQPSSSKVDNPFCSKLEQNSNVQSCANVLLGTAIVQVQDKFGSWHSIRCLLDSGSQTSIISLRLAQLLKLPWKSSSVHISGIDSDLPVKAKGELVCHILPHQKMLKSKTKPINVQAVILSKIANNLSPNVSNVVLEQFSHLTLADQSYLNSNLDSTIDLLIGAEHYCNLMDPSISMLVGNPSAIPTKLGWLLLGKTPSIVPSTSNVCKTFFVTEDFAKILGN